MRCKTILKGFPLRINIALLVIAIICAAISSLSDKETLRNICFAIGCLLTLAAVVPSSFWSIWEQLRKGEGRCVEDPNTVILGWKQFCQSMGIEKDIKLKVFPNLRNAYHDGTTIEIGQPVLDNLDSVSIKAVFAHELAHSKIDYAYKLKHLLVIILVGVVLVTLWWLVFVYSVGPLGIFTYSALLIITIGFMGIVMRFISWPDEYKADLIAKQYVNREAVVSSLTTVAALRRMDVRRDFYRHPSITKRIANLDCHKKQGLKNGILNSR
jgi:Zn-dependent protease with chaperone function